VSSLNAAALASLAGWIDDRLDNENADRQTICEDVAAQLRNMAAAVRESAPPAGRPAYTAAAAGAITQAHAAEHDFAGWLAGVLAAVAAGLGSSDVLIQGRPGSWEASLVDQLVKGTVGWDDEYLGSYRPMDTSDTDPETGEEFGVIPGADDAEVQR
jgi:hypothetical protein